MKKTILFLTLLLTALGFQQNHGMHRHELRQEAEKQLKLAQDLVENNGISPTTLPTTSIDTIEWVIEQNPNSTFFIANAITEDNLDRISRELLITLARANITATAMRIADLLEKKPELLRLQLFNSNIFTLLELGDARFKELAKKQEKQVQEQATQQPLAKKPTFKEQFNVFLTKNGLKKPTR